MVRVRSVSVLPRLAAALMAGTAVSLLAVKSAAAQSGPAAQPSLNIPAQPLSKALIAFSKQTKIEVIVPSAAAAGKQSTAVSGTLAPESALQQLLGGTGLTFSFNGSTFSVNDPNAAGNAAGATVDGAIALDTIDVSGANAAQAAADAPYQTPGSSSHVSREQLDRVPPISAGDVFRSTPGVISAGNRVGASINPNIRGLQGMGRVNTTVDGARQTTSSYRGYIGNRDETYVDPDMIGGIDISKGPSDGVGVGGVGGNINFRTLEAGDIIKPGQTSGTRVKTGFGTNTGAPPAIGTTASADRPGIDLGTYSGSFATAVARDNYEGIFAFSRRKQGNYFVGTKVPEGIIFSPAPNNNSLIRPGAEAHNTSEDATSFLAKGKVRWGDGHSLQLGYTYYGSEYGEVSELFMPFSQNGGIVTYGQFALSETSVNTYTAKYEYNPADNPLVHLRADLWHSDLDTPLNAFGEGGANKVHTTGLDVSNDSQFDTPLGRLTWTNGFELVREHVWAKQFTSAITYSEGWETYGPSGVRDMVGAFSKAKLDVTDWLTVSAGGRYDHYESYAEGYLTKFPERSGERFSPNASVVLTPVEGIQFYGQYSEGYRPPSLRESHWHYQGLLWNNPYLSGETARNSEVGLNVLRNGVVTDGDALRFKAALFDNTYDDYIVRMRGVRHNGVPLPGSDPTRYHWYNIDSANYRGYELSGSYDARAFFVEGAFTKYLSTKYCDGGVCSAPTGTATAATNALRNDYSANYIPPEYSGSVTGGVRLFDEALTLGGRVNFSSARIGSIWPPPTPGFGTIGAGGLSWPSYFTYDVFGSFKVTEDVMVNASVENITDEFYFGALTSTGIPSPGRTVRVGLTRTLGEDAFPTVPDLTLGRAAEGTPGSNWTGLYFGGHVGYGFAGMGGVTTAADGTPGGIAATESVDLDRKDLPRGAQVGFNYQLPNRFVVGVEGDFSWSTLDGNQKAVTTESASLALGQWAQAETDYEFDWSATLRGRLGYAYDRFLIYGTGGLAFLKEEQERTQYLSAGTPNAGRPIGLNTEAAFKESASAMRVGWTAGAGAEYALTSNWSLKAEYLFADFGQETFLFPGARGGIVKGYDTTIRCLPNNSTPPCPGGVVKIITNHTAGSSETANGRKASNDLDLHTIKLGINYRF